MKEIAHPLAPSSVVIRTDISDLTAEATRLEAEVLNSESPPVESEPSIQGIGCCPKNHAMESERELIAVGDN